MLWLIDTRSSRVGPGSGTGFAFVAGLRAVSEASRPARSVAADDARWTGTALSGCRRIGAGRRARCVDESAPIRGRPAMRGFGASARVLELATAGLVGGHGWVRAAGVRGQGGAELAAASLSLSCPGFTGSGRLRHPLGRARFGTGVSPCNPRFAAQAQARLSWRAKRLRFGGHRVAALPHHCPPQGFPGPPCPSPENRTRGGRRRQWAGGTPRQQER